MTEIIDLEKPEVPKVQKGFIVAEIILLAFSSIGFLFKFAHLPGATIFLVLGLGSYAILMFPVGLVYKGWTFKVINFFSTFLIIGCLFGLMMWPGNQFSSLIGIMGLVIIIPILIFSQKKDASFFNNHKVPLFRVALFAGLALMLKFMHPKTFYGTFVSDDPIEIELYYATIQNPSDSEAKEDYIRYRKSKSTSFNSPDSTDVPKP
jgi:hypothetical protein